MMGPSGRPYSTLAVVAGVLLAVASTACFDDDDGRAGTATAPPTATSTQIAEPTPAASPSPDVTAGASPTEGPTAAPTREPGDVESSAQLAYVDPDGVVWLVDADGDRRFFMDGCVDRSSGFPRAFLLWSANGSKLACEGAGGWARGVDAGSGEPVQLLEGCHSFFSWSPSGEWLACGTSLVSAEGGEPFGIEGTFPVGNVAWAPTADLLVLQRSFSDADGHSSREIVDLDGTLLLHIERQFGFIEDIAWRDDGAAVAYSGADGLTVHDLPEGARRDLDTGWLSHLRWEFSTDIQWALDGRAILAWAQDEGAQVYFIDAATGAPLGPDPISAHTFEVAPDGVHVAALTSGDLGGGVRVLNLESGDTVDVGGTVVRFEHGAQLGTLAFSNDSARVCWIESPHNAPPGQPSRCFNVDGGGLAEVTPAIAHSIRTPVGEHRQQAFSRDLRRVAYVTGDDDQRLWVANADGSDAVEVGPIVWHLAFAWRP